MGRLWPQSEPTFHARPRSYKDFVAAAEDGEIVAKLAERQIRREAAASFRGTSKFVREFIEPNLPVVVSDGCSEWRALQEWADLDKLIQRCGDLKAPVVSCFEQNGGYEGESLRGTAPVRQFFEHMRHKSRRNTSTNEIAEITSLVQAIKHVKALFDNLDQLEEGREFHFEVGDKRILYLKDFHLERETDYTCDDIGEPFFIPEDWMDHFWRTVGSEPGNLALETFDPNKSQKDDFRFAYCGEKDSFTPFHRDVIGSFSWSAQIRGQKLWLFAPPDLQSRLDSDSDNDIDVTGITNVWKCPTVLRHCYALLQLPGDVVFVPSNWWHQVHNLSNITISVNRNWSTRHNVDLMFERVFCELQREIYPCIAPCFDSDNDESGQHRDRQDMWKHLEVVLRSCAGISLQHFRRYVLFVLRNYELEPAHNQVMQRVLSTIESCSVFHATTPSSASHGQVEHELA
ncbi:MAG: hypothetical protein MHM6MM_006481 [Cercozoa sp. M6MM]